MSYLSSEFNKLQGGIEAALRRGTTNLSELNNLTPNTEYMIVCFGWDGAPTTELFIHKFKTVEANDDAKNLVVDFEITHLGYGDMRVECTPSLGAWCSQELKTGSKIANMYNILFIVYLLSPCCSCRSQ